MIRLIHFFVRQKLFINLLVVLVFLAGGYILARMNREAFPNVNFDRVSIQTLYPGASPDEIEQLISIPIEKELREIAGLKKVKSYNLENISVFVIEIEPDISDEQKRKTIDDIKDAVDTVRGDLPAGAEQPIVEEITFDTQPALDIAITIDSDQQNPDEQYRELRRTARELEDYIYDISGVAEVERFGYLDREYRVEVRPEALQRYRVGFNSIANAIRDRNFDLPGGVLRLGADEYLLRTKEQYRNINEVRNTVVRANLGGGGLRVRDVGSVYDTFEEAKILEHFNGHNAIILKIWKKNDADMLTLTDEVKRRLAEFENRIDTDRITIEYFNDYSRFVRVRLSSLIINGIIGFVLLGLTMFIILGPRMSFIVGMSIPTAFMVAFIGREV